MKDRPPEVAVVLNGNAKSVNDKVISTLEAALPKGSLFVSRRLDEAPKIARSIIEGGFRTLLTGGGDGTFTIMVTETERAALGAQVHAPRYGILKLGTGNALAWVVGAAPVPMGAETPNFTSLALSAAARRFHLVTVDGLLSPFAGVGADAQILADYNKTKAQLEKTPLAAFGQGLSGYGLAAMSKSLPKLLFQAMPEIRVVTTGSEAYRVDPHGRARESLPEGSVLFEGQARMAALSSIPYYGFGMKLFPFAEPASGFVNLRVSKLGSPQFLSHVRGIWNGTYHDPAYLSDFLIKSVRIECAVPLDFQIGGDSQGRRDRVEAGVSGPIELLDFPGPR